MKGENKDGEETGPVNEKHLCGQQRPFKRPRVKVTQGGEILRDVMSPGRGTTGLLFAQNLHVVTHVCQNSWPSSWQTRVCLRGPPEFCGASECLIANWLN